MQFLYVVRNPVWTTEKLTLGSQADYLLLWALPFDPHHGVDENECQSYWQISKLQVFILQVYHFILIFKIMFVNGGRE